MDQTTVSFDVDAYPPPPLAIMEHSISSEISSHYSIIFPSFDSTSSSSMIYIPPDFADELLCQPFLTTPEPTLSPSIFDNALFPPAQAPFAEPNADPFMAQASSSQHLRQMTPSACHVPSEDENIWVMVYDHVFDCYKVTQPESLDASDMNMIVELSPFDDTPKTYTQL